MENQTAYCTGPVIGCIFGYSGGDVEYDLVMEANYIPFRSRRWLWIALIWFGFGLIDATQTVLVMRAEGMHHAWVALQRTK